MCIRDRRRTAQNIVWGGIAGCMPVLIGWAAVRGTLEWPAFVLFAFIFLWTPPHYWPLSMKYAEDYSRAGVPMLGAVDTARTVGAQVVLYAWATVICSLLLIPVGGAGWVYGIIALLSGAWFTYHCHKLYGLARAGRPTLKQAMYVLSLIHISEPTRPCGTSRMPSSTRSSSSAAPRRTSCGAGSPGACPC